MKILYNFSLFCYCLFISLLASINQHSFAQEISVKGKFVMDTMNHEFDKFKIDLFSERCILKVPLQHYSINDITVLVLDFSGEFKYNFMDTIDVKNFPQDFVDKFKIEFTIEFSNTLNDPLPRHREKFIVPFSFTEIEKIVKSAIVKRITSNEISIETGTRQEMFFKINDLDIIRTSDDPKRTMVPFMPDTTVIENSPFYRNTWFLVSTSTIIAGVSGYLIWLNNRKDDPVPPVSTVLEPPPPFPGNY